MMIIPLDPAAFLDSSTVEQPAVYRWVVGSNPTRGAILSLALNVLGFFGCDRGRFLVTLSI